MNSHAENLVQLCNALYHAVSKAERVRVQASHPLSSNVLAWPQLIAISSGAMSATELSEVSSKEGAAAVCMHLLGLERSTCCKLFKSYFGRPTKSGGGGDGGDQVQSVAAEDRWYKRMCMQARQGLVGNKKAMLPDEAVEFAYSMLKAVRAHGQRTES